MDEKEARMHKGIGIRGRNGLLIASAAYAFALLMTSGKARVGHDFLTVC